MMYNSKLNPEIRREEILKLIKDKTIIEVIDLMNIFNTSRATITHDISILEKKDW